MECALYESRRWVDCGLLCDYPWSDHCGSDTGLDSKQNVPWSHFKKRLCDFQSDESQTGAQSRNGSKDSKLYGRPAEDGNGEEENEEEDGDGGGEGGDLLEVEEMDLIALEEEENAIVPVYDTSLVEAQQRAKDYMTRTKAKPHRGEDENTFAERIANIMFSGNADRKTRSQMKTNHRVGETTMTTEEVGAAAEARTVNDSVR